MDQDNIELLTQTLKKTFMDGVEKIQDYDMEDFKEVVDAIAKNISLSLYYDEGIESVLSRIDLGVDNICGQFGSSDSTDMDFFVVLREPKSAAFMNAVREYYKVWFRGMFQARMMEFTDADIQFITVDSTGIVDWAEKGNETEINNAIFSTYHYHILNMAHQEGDYRTCPVRRMVKPEIGIKALKTVRSLLTFLSRTEHREVSKELLFRNDLTSRIEHIISLNEASGLLLGIDGKFNKPNNSNTDILKSITFSFLQLHAMVFDRKVPYTKHGAIWTTPYTVAEKEYEVDHHLLAFSLLRHDSIHVDDRRTYLRSLDELITITLERVKDLIVFDEGGVVEIEGDSHMYHVRKETKID